MEQAALYIVLGGAGLVGLAWLWLIINAFRVGKGWGWVVLLLPPVGLLFALVHPGKAGRPLTLLLIGALVGGGTATLNYRGFFIDLGPREKVVDGEIHITLTGWDRKDYSILQKQPDTVVLQMANADVTDDTLHYLEGMDQLRELDLNDTKITDAGLAILAKLPKLESLRLRKTAITDEGFREQLFNKASLMQLDLTGTKVASKTVREWRAAKADRKALR